MLENYSSDNLNIALINASVIWGDKSFTAQMPQEIRQMTIANGLAMTPANLKPSPTGEVVASENAFEIHGASSYVIIDSDSLSNS
jgi:hypothetical protein